MSQYLIDQINNTANIDERVHTTILEAIGTDRLEALVIKDNITGSIETVAAAALFAFIGAKPHSEFVSEVVE